ncbi:type 1 fimbria pilin [Buttiauxella sp. BIGb0471]|uniref:fimbrial protein n=1 Tax=Buttiauxella sp. BIGb0471 TaxID=2940597 RepID=UPI00216A230B|nr:fimbrial protein [Buttiauxella sp. BIGb0471]MCS3601919.1 type 1 fimbria pilin [Buttiauxella sp. BIGb0471]
MNIQNAQRQCFGHKFIKIVILTLLAGVTLKQQAFATEGEQGELHVHGQLVSGACDLDMGSTFQDVMLGNYSRGELLNSGDEGRAVTFVLRLHNCKQTGSNQINRYTGTRSWDTIQPSLTVSFLAHADADRPSLFAVTGVSGVGLLLRDGLGRQVSPGMRGEPQFVSVSNDELVYKISLVRTSGPLTTGQFRAVADFQVNYD